jgi:hypothetical protein
MIPGLNAADQIRLEGIFHFLDRADRQLRSEIIFSGNGAEPNDADLKTREIERRLQASITACLNTGQFVEAHDKIKQLEELQRDVDIRTTPGHAIDIAKAAEICRQKIEADQDEIYKPKGNTPVGYLQKGICEDDNL